MSLILAIDQSTSATKALLFDVRAGRVVAKASVEHRQIFPQPGWVEHDAEEIWQNTLAAVGQLPAADPVCVSITNQRETVVAFDRATGRPCGNALVWQDRRGEPLCAALAKTGHDPAVSAKTGLRIDPYFSASKIAWLMQNRPDIAAALRDGSAGVGTIDAYLIHRLTAGRTFATDHTNASRTLLYDIRKLCWDKDLCALFGVPPQALPVVRDSTARFGQTDFDGRLARSTPICGVMGDSQASLLAHRCLRAGDAKVTLGSGSSILLNVGDAFRPPAAEGGACATIAWTHAGRATYSFEGIINYSGATIAWLKDQLGLIASAGETEAIAESIPDNGGVYLVPAFGGLSAPYWAPSARGAMVGLSAHSDRRHVVRAGLESIAYQIRDALQAMRAAAGVELAAINADGGPTRNRFLMQFIADITRVSIAAADVAECSPLGAAFAGAVGMGVAPSLAALAELPREATVYTPKMPEDRAERLFHGWQQAVRQVLAGVSA